MDEIPIDDTGDSGILSINLRGFVRKVARSFQERLAETRKDFPKHQGSWLLYGSPAEMHSAFAVVGSFQHRGFWNPQNWSAVLLRESRAAQISF